MSNLVRWVPRGVVHEGLSERLERLRERQHERLELVLVLADSGGFQPADEVAHVAHNREL